MTKVLTIRADTGADYSLDNVTGLDTCEKTYAPAYAAPAPAMMQGEADRPLTPPHSFKPPP